MTKALASYPKNKRDSVAAARRDAARGGLGTLAAIDAEAAAIRAKIIEQGQKPLPANTAE